MGYQTFMSNTTATLSLAALVSMSSGGLHLDTKQSSLTNSSYSIYNGTVNKTYSELEDKSNLNINEDIEAIMAFADKIIGNSQPLDADIAQLVNDNIMDLLS